MSLIDCQSLGLYTQRARRIVSLPAQPLHGRIESLSSIQLSLPCSAMSQALSSQMPSFYTFTATAPTSFSIFFPALISSVVINPPGKR